MTAVDSSILLDVFGADPEYGPRSREALRKALAEGALMACSIVWAEVSAAFESAGGAAEAMGRLGVTFSAMTLDDALSAGQVWREYRRRGGARSRIIADFLIGAHAQARADRLLTRDRGFFRSYFRRLRVVDPSATA